MKKLALIAGVAFVATTSAAMANEHRVEAYFDRMDVNNDGMISKAEHDSFANAMFVEADTNSNGSLSKDEVMAFKKIEKARMKSSSMQNNPNAKMNVSHGEKLNTNPSDHSVNK